MHTIHSIHYILGERGSQSEEHLFAMMLAFQVEILLLKKNQVSQELNIQKIKTGKEFMHFHLKIQGFFS